MITVATLGSCIAEFTAKKLAAISSGTVCNITYQWRSDQFCGYLIDKQFEFIDEEYLQREVLPYFDPSKAYILKLQGKAPIQAFLDSIPRADIVLLDNLTDLNIALFDNIHPDHPASPLQIRHADKAKTSARFRSMGLLSPEESYRDVQRCVDFIKSRNGNAEIFFLQYPNNCYAGFEKNARFQQFIEATSLKNAVVLPSLVILPQDMKDHLHFSDQVYETMALAVAKAYQHEVDFRLYNKKTIAEFRQYLAQDFPTFRKAFVELLQRKNATLRQQLHHAQHERNLLQQHLVKITTRLWEQGRGSPLAVTG